MHLRVLRLACSLLFACDRSADSGAAKTAEAKTIDAKPTDAKLADAKASDTRPTDAKIDGKTEAKTEAKTDAKTDDAAAPAKPTPPSPEVRAKYRGHLAEGRRLAKAGQWKEAIVEFDAALAAIPGDDRALGELSWAAFSAGDLARAREAGEAAVRVTTTPKVKGASLYNLGRALEASGDTEGAREAYRASLAARPNDVVRKRLETLGAPPPATPHACAAPRLETELCVCATKLVDAEYAETAANTCEVSKLDLDGFAMVRHQTSDVGEETVLLAARSTGGWGIVTELGTVYNPGMFGITEEWSVSAIQERTVGGRQVIEIETKNARGDTDMGLSETETETTVTVTWCVRDGEALSCPVQRTARHEYDRERDTDLGELDEEMRSMATPGLPIHEEVEVSLELGEDGVIRATRVEGKPDAQMLASERLW
jgi:tetratricopeptide (TPR) repeat protein